MISIGIILVVLSLHAIADASKLTFSKINGRVYVETDPFNYAMYGQVSDKDGQRIVVVNGDEHSYQTSRCEDEKESLSGIKSQQLDDYRKLRDIYLKEERESPAISGVPTQSYIWSTLFFYDESMEYSTIRLDDNTVVYSSRYFPNNLARVIITGKLVIFIHYDETITMKRIECLFINEEILINGIQTIDVDGKRKHSLIKPKGENALKKYIKNHPIDQDAFQTEQIYIKTYTKQELAELDKAVRSQAFNSFNGYWGPTIGWNKS